MIDALEAAINYLAGDADLNLLTEGRIAAKAAVKYIVENGGMPQVDPAAIDGHSDGDDAERLPGGEEGEEDAIVKDSLAGDS